ncbi:MAG: DMT family transporter [Bacteroidetes bacterium]|nr:DMT family transporter [Bacteroidota bacterium]
MSAKLRSDLILILAAVIWGFAFVAQRIGMDYVGPFTFNGARFTLGALVVIPFLFSHKKFIPKDPSLSISRGKMIWGVIGTGLLLFSGASLQQVGLQFTTAGKAGFITGLYVVFVPFIGLFLGHRTTIFTWLGVLFSAAGLYFLSITSGFRIDRGDLLVLACAFVFTFHVLLIGWLSPRMSSFHLAAGQFAICAFLSIGMALICEPIVAGDIVRAALPILYGGIMSVGIAFTLQVIAQKEAHPASVSIILSMEAVVAAFGGWMILHESLTLRMLAGCLLILTGIVIVQLKRL